MSTGKLISLYDKCDSNQILFLLLTGCVMLGKLFNISGFLPLFFSLVKQGHNINSGLFGN